ncbi:MAG TPA: M1 family aminopeptidase [Azonexus sp.]
MISILRRLFLPVIPLLFSGLAGAMPALELEVTLDPATRALRADAKLTPADRDFSFLLHESLQVTRASAAGKALPVEQRAGPAGLRQWLIRQPKAGEQLQISYAGQLPALDRQRDHRGVLQRMPPMSSPEGSFLPAGSAWYPQPPGMFDYRVRLSLPGDQRALVAGRRVAETLPAAPGERYRATFEFRQPTDGVDLMAGPWRVREKTVARKDGTTLALRTYFPAELDSEPGLVQGYLDDTQRYIERYSQEIGDYPYSEFSIVAGPLPTGFGMPTLTYLGEAVVRLPFIRKTSLGHEILHNWWGNGVYVDYARGNWSEGLTTFMADYAYKEAESAAAAAEMRLAWLRDALSLPPADQPALRDFRSRAHGAAAAVGYGKSAMLFVMLRDRIGEAAFRQGIRDFWASRRFTVASWDDLQAAFERASGQELGPFFAAWLERRVMPAVVIAGAETKPLGNRHRLSLEIRQGEPPLPLRLPVEISGPGRREVRWIDLASARSVVSLDLDFVAQGARLDPELRVWRELDAANVPSILRRWIGAAAPRVFNVATAPDAVAAVDPLIQRFFERPARLVNEAGFAAALRGKDPVLLVGTPAEVERTLAASGLPARPEQLAGRGTAQVWTVQRPDDGKAGLAPLAVISVSDAAALRALQRGLPHYGSQSWLVFDNAQVSAKGTWPVSLPVTPVVSPPAAGERRDSR